MAYYYRSAGARPFVQFGLIAPIGLLILFVFAVPVRGIPVPGLAEESARLGRPTPVVLVMFDALGVVSLMDEDRDVDGELFPNFARLASDATWYRNATSHNASTRTAIPGMVTGNRLPWEERHSAPSSEHNIFNLLPDDHRMVAYEPFISMCAEDRCEYFLDHEHWKRWRRLAGDGGLLALHALTPEAVRNRLPPMETVLGRFAGGRPDYRHDDDEGHQQAWDWFLGELRRGAQPSLYYFHWMKPHFPWTYLPTGQESEPLPREPHGGYLSRVWQDDWLTTAQWQRQLLQVGYVDRLLGELIDTLQRKGMYDETLLIVASDHGEAFTVGSPTRIPSTGNLGEVAFISLFVKKPGQTTGEVVDEPAELVDVQPTITSVLQLEGAGRVDGRSLLMRPPSSRERSIHGWDFEGDLSASGEELTAPLARKHETFGTEGGWERLFAVGPHRGLIGRHISEVPTLHEGRASVTVEDLERFSGVEPDAKRIPSLVMGTVRDHVELDEPMPVALAVDDVIVAVAETYGMDGTTARVFAVLPPKAFDDGAEELAIFKIQEGAGTDALALQPMNLRASERSDPSRPW